MNMMDIGTALNDIIETEQCSPIHALFILSGEGDTDGICKLQSESETKISRRLRYSSDIKSFKYGMGRYIS